MFKLRPEDEFAKEQREKAAGGLERWKGLVGASRGCGCELRRWPKAFQVRALTCALSVSDDSLLVGILMQ